MDGTVCVDFTVFSDVDLSVGTGAVFWFGDTAIEDGRVDPETFWMDGFAFGFGAEEAIVTC